MVSVQRLSAQFKRFLVHTCAREAESKAQFPAAILTHSGPSNTFISFNSALVSAADTGWLEKLFAVVFLLLLSVAVLTRKEREQHLFFRYRLRLSWTLRSRLTVRDIASSKDA